MNPLEVFLQLYTKKLSSVIAKMATVLYPFTRNEPYVPDHGVEDVSEN